MTIKKKPVDLVLREPGICQESDGFRDLHDVTETSNFRSFPGFGSFLQCSHF